MGPAEVTTDGTRLHARNPFLYKSDEVKAAVSYLRHTQLPVHSRPPHIQLQGYLEFLKDIAGWGLFTGYAESMAHEIEANVIKPNHVPATYFDWQKRLLWEQGYGEVQLTADLKQQMIETLQSDQRASLREWAEYLAASKDYPDWFKFYVFEAVKKLAPYSKEKQTFPQRSRGTVAQFAELNREALANVYQAMVEGSASSFESLYGAELTKFVQLSEDRKADQDGIWRLYPQSNDPNQAKELSAAIAKWGTGWCTAGESTAHSQLAQGDFHVYYTRDRDGEFRVPRIAIRMANGRVAELRGVNKGQELEAAMLDIAKAKLAELPGGDRYEKAVLDMKLVTKLDAVTQETPGAEIAPTELRCLYEIDRKIESFGYQRDPRIDAVRSRRNVKSDLSKILGIPETKISTTKREALSGHIIFHYGDLYLSGLTSGEGLQLPLSIGGSLYLSGLTSGEGLQLPSSIGGFLYLSGLTSGEGLQLPSSVQIERIIAPAKILSGLKSEKMNHTGLSRRPGQFALEL